MNHEKRPGEPVGVKENNQEVSFSERVKLGQSLFNELKKVWNGDFPGEHDKENILKDKFLKNFDSVDDFRSFVKKLISVKEIDLARMLTIQFERFLEDFSILAPEKESGGDGGSTTPYVKKPEESLLGKQIVTGIVGGMIGEAIADKIGEHKKPFEGGGGQFGGDGADGNW